MSALGLAWQTAAAAVQLAQTLVSTVAAASARRRARLQPIPFGRKHFWTYTAATPECVYCGAPLESRIEYDQCGGPPPRPRAVR